MAQKVTSSVGLADLLLTCNKGDGTTDDTQAINKAISDQNRCGKDCDSSTTNPALVYFPPGQYRVTAPIVQYYYTQLVGDAISLPTIKADPSFQGMAVIDSNPYEDDGSNWYTNQNNFYRQIRNFVIDLTAMPSNKGAGIHWQVAQATSLQNIRFEMVKGGADGNKQQGIFMDNGSGGFMTDLTFNGGNYGMFLGNQQFTTRNLTFNGCGTAVFMNWNWLWSLKSLSVNNCGVGVNMSNSPSNMTVGSVIIQDSVFSNTPKGVITARSKSKNVPAMANTLIIDNCQFSGDAVVDIGGNTILKGGKIDSWAQGNAYTTGANGTTPACAESLTQLYPSSVQGTLSAPSKPANLLSNGKVFERSRPQYENVPTSSFVSIKSQGAKGDGKTDDTAAIQAALNKATADQVVYFDHGAYIVSSTIKVPPNVRITGEMWPLIVASGQAFSAQSSPSPVFQVGQAGQNGSVEMSDLIFTTKGAQPGAIFIEWNLAASTQGSSGLWDVHARVGGFAGSDLQSDKCFKTPNSTTSVNPACEGAFLLLHITKSASNVYVENAWFWIADHELDRQDHGQINVYNGRGVLIESAHGPTWLYGTSSEHSQLYNYQVSGASNVYMSLIQTETPYMQSNPTAVSGGFAPLPNWADPAFAYCTTDACKKSWGLRVYDSTDVLIYGAGLYSFFDNYQQTCLVTESCQENMVSVECSEQITIWGLSTKASTSMVSTDKNKVLVKQEENRSTFCSTLALFEEV